MTALVVTLGILAIVAIIGGAILWAYKVEQQRTAQFEAVAAEMGLSFHDKQVNALRFQVGDFRLFSTGRGRKFKNIMVADTPEARIGIFDYQYTTGSGKHARTHTQTVAVIESSDLNIPEFSLRPEVSFFDTIGNLIGFQDIDFADHPAFSRSFVLKSPDELATRELLDESLLDFFSERPKISLEAQSGAVIYFRAHKRIKPVELRDFFEQAFTVYKALLDRLSRHGSRPEANSESDE